MNTNNCTLLVCDEPCNIQTKYNLVVYWSSFAEDANVYSIPKIIESESSSLKKNYLNWLYDLGHVQINGSSIIEHLAIRDDFSLWWMSLLIEKSHMKSPALYNVFRLMAFDMFLKKHNVSEVVITVKDEAIHDTFREWGRETGVDVKISVKTGIYDLFSVRKLHELIPSAAQAILLILGFLGKSFLTNRYKNKKTELKNNSVCFISYFDNQDKKSAENGQFYSFYWTKLHALLENTGRRVNWLHMFAASNVASSLTKASKLIHKFNSKSDGLQTHYLLESYTDWKLVKNITVDYFKLWLVGWKIRNVRTHFKVKECEFNLWYVLKGDWKSSLFGKSGALNLISLNLYENVFRDLPCQHQGYYLLENQGWEKSLIYAWRKYGHGKLVGVAHTFLRSWDLRHQFNNLEYKMHESLALPIPDLIALNGDAAIKYYRSLGFPLERITKVEALRYLYLNSLSPETTSSNTFRNIRLLVLGDYQPAVTSRQMRLLKEFLDNFNGEIEVLIKSHPNCIIDPKQFFLKNISVTEQPLSNLVDKYDVAFTSNTTSAAVDVYLSGKTVITMLDPTTFNMSPLRGFSDINFIATELDFLKAIIDISKISFQKNNNENFDINNFFYLNENLPKWSHLLEN